jgi:hypothetical protein
MILHGRPLTLVGVENLLSPVFAMVARRRISMPLDKSYEVGSFDIGSHCARAFVVPSCRLFGTGVRHESENRTAVGPQVALTAARGGSETEMNGGRADPPPGAGQGLSALAWRRGRRNEPSTPTERGYMSRRRYSQYSCGRSVYHFQSYHGFANFRLREQ